MLPALPPAAFLLAALAAPPDLPTVTVDRDDVEIRESCRLRFLLPVADANGNGVVQVVGDGITVDLDGGVLLGSLPDVPPEARTGTGIVVTGKGVTLRNGSVRGFRCGVRATGADGATIERLDLSGNFTMRLASTPAAEAASDWLWPHENERREWVTRYGAGLLVEGAKDLTVREITVRGTQNGILLDRVTGSKVYDNDCSFLSGWGLALYRSSGNTIARNAFDFCIRGYSHGVYNRGQDSAGILLFEQSSDNLVALNSATHSGDGFFGFAGREALGERPPAAPPEPGWHSGRGSNRNRVIGNDFSYAAAHGIEMTFSTGNVFAHNRCVENGISGFWGGYSRQTLVVANEFARNAAGSIDIEHGVGNLIWKNSFEGDATAIELWDDVDAELAKTPWAKANRIDPGETSIRDNRFAGVATAIEIRGSDADLIDGNTVAGATVAVRLVDATGTIIGRNDFGGAAVETGGAEVRSGPIPMLDPKPIPTPEELATSLPGTRNPIGARSRLRGRDRIVMTPYGPYDWASAALFPVRTEPHQQHWRALGIGPAKGVDVFGTGPLRVVGDADRGLATIYSDSPGFVMPYRIRFRHEDGNLDAFGTIALADWAVRFFPLATDPREDPAGWKAASTGPDSVEIVAPAIDFAFGNDGPSSLAPTPLAAEILADAKLPSDRFGTTAKATLRFPAGRWNLHVESDDGVRLRADGATLIDDWTWHPPRVAVATLEVAEARDVALELDHFELDGFSVLRLVIDGDPAVKPWDGRTNQPKPAGS
jgi:parallel beta-helix repeat protein